MTDEPEHTPREHDHLVEPLFAALRENREAEGQRDRRLLWVAGLVGAIVLALVVASLLR